LEADRAQLRLVLRAVGLEVVVEPLAAGELLPRRGRVLATHGYPSKLITFASSLTREKPRNPAARAMLGKNPAWGSATVAWILSGLIYRRSTILYIGCSFLAE
jgi:hypothetical protein